MVEVKELEEAIKNLSQILEDRTVPRNIKEAVERAKNALEDESKELKVRIDAAIHALEEVSNDPNMPIYTRTQIWSIVSLLESI
ncbi:hypothetical protein DRN63_01755 [Nanoarchaeota archaeon]|nr:MAG: hypothetical protein DRN63_01755 [Nanoarchaeota archaeon]